MVGRSSLPPDILPITPPTLLTSVLLAL
jgi:hypothetical protein